MIFVNFKTYPEASGDNAVAIASALSKVSTETGVEVVLCPQAEDLEDVVASISTPVWAQHVDPEKRGRATGFVPPEVVKEAGAEGTFLNHSEHKLEFGVLVETMKRCKEVGIKTLIFADGLDEVKRVAELVPDYVGYEPPELVGSRTTSVSSAKPEVIKQVVEAVSVPVIVGAGVHTEEDIRVGLSLGAVGFAVATKIVLSEDHAGELRKLIAGYKS